ncbi:MAG: DNA polymerase III subunit epsilon [Parvibaculaceae bacterium]
MREIVLDTETTGLDPASGHRIVEIGAVELINHIPSGRTFHAYVNPERDMPAEAFAVHGLTAEFLSAQRVFAAIADEFEGFVGIDRLVIHNAAFDVGFLDWELRLLGRAPIARARIVDTLALARQRHPTSPNSLDALCRRYGIDNARREKHGALLDAELLAAVYLELVGGRQASLALAAARMSVGDPRQVEIARRSPRPVPLPSRLTADEEAAHARLVGTLGARALWLKFETAAPA